MSNVSITIENLSKQYRLGLVGTGTLAHDLKRWWAVSVMRGEDPYLKIGEANVQKDKGTSQYVWALRDINLEVRQGEVLGIIGRNGAGKSTLLKILSRVTRPTTGTVSYRGRIASLLEVGTGFHPEMTGRENIFMNGSIMGMTKAEIKRKFDEIVDFAGVERYIDTPVKRYSSGMTVRLGFAVAAHLEPEILVVDEVLAVGDAEFQKKAVGKMQDVSRQEGRTVLFVSHNMAAVRNLCFSGLHLHNGEISFFGKIEECIDHYINDNFYKSSPINNFLAEKEGIKVRVEFNDKGRRDNIVFAGNPLEVYLSINADKPIYHGSLGLGINDLHGTRIMTYHSKYELKDPLTIDKNLVVIINESFNKLCPGEYEIILTIFDNDRSLVSFPQIGLLRVEENDVYKTGKLPNITYQGKVLSNANWEIK